MALIDYTAICSLQNDGTNFLFLNIWVLVYSLVKQVLLQFFFSRHHHSHCSSVHTE